MTCVIRRALPGDEDKLAYIQTESWKSAFKNLISDEVLQRTTEINRAIAMYQKLLVDNLGNGYLLEIDGEPHCIAWWDKTREEDMIDYAELICIHSLPNNWRKGFGTMMMNKVLNDIKECGYKKVMLWFFTENNRARKFYEANGFVTYGKEKPYYNTRVICYEKVLG